MEDQLTRRTRVGATSSRIPVKGLVGVVALACLIAAGVGVTVYARPTAILCACLAIASLSWYSPVPATRVALVLLVITPFLVVIPPFRPQEINYYLLFAVVVVPVAVVVFARSSRPTFDSGALFLIVVLVSAVVTLLTQGTLAADYGYLLWPVTTIAVYLMVLNSQENLHRWLSGSVLAFASVEALLGISQSIVGRPVFSIALPTLYRTDRGLLGYVLPGLSTSVANGSGTFQHFNGLGSLLALTLPLSLGLLLRRPSSAWRVALLGILALGLALTYSRGAWLGGILGCLFVIWRWHPRGSRAWIPLLLGVTIVCVALLTTSIVRYYDATQNVSTRMVTWRFAVSSWLEHSSWIPLGSGFGLFQQRLLTAEGAIGTQTLSALHSSFLQILLELGVLGLCVFGWLLYTTARPRLTGPGSAWQTAALGGVFAFLISQSLDNALFAVTGTCAFALIACLRRADTRVVFPAPARKTARPHLPAPQEARRSAQGRSIDEHVA